MATGAIAKARIIDKLEVSILGVEVTNSDTAGYYAAKKITGLPSGAVPFSIDIASRGYEGGLSYTLYYNGEDWYIAFSSAKSMTIPASGIVRNLWIYYYIE